MDDKYFNEELVKLDREISDLNIEIADETTQKISKAIGVNLPKSKRAWKLISVRIDKKVSIPICVCLLLAGLMVYGPTAVTAISNAIRETIFNTTDKTTDIKISEKNRTKYLFDIPDGFDLTESIVNKNVCINTYCKSADMDAYITISCGTENSEIYLDNEDVTFFEEFEIEGNKAILIEKKGITSVVFQYKNDLIEVSGNLPKSEIQEIAESIRE